VTDKTQKNFLPQRALEELEKDFIYIVLGGGFTNKNN
jgi:hypothetical protein